MKPNELRIGNLLKYPAYNKDGSDGVFMVRDIYMDGDKIGLTTGRIQTKVDFDSVAPIPLTAEWLLKFGFTHDKEQQIYNRHDMCVSYDETYEGYKLYVNHEYETGNSFMYVHQLQNLYFALTGEELKIIES